jgi:hypothetical protein
MKQETLEDIAQWVIEFRFTKNEYAKVSDSEMYHTIIEKVTKWQQERSYSDNEVIAFCEWFAFELNHYGYPTNENILKALKQFKNK